MVKHNTTGCKKIDRTKIMGRGRKYQMKTISHRKVSKTPQTSASSACIRTTGLNLIVANACHDKEGNRWTWIVQIDEVSNSLLMNNQVAYR